MYCFRKAGNLVRVEVGAPIYNLENHMNEQANKELDNLIEWVTHKGGWANAPINRKQHEDRIAEMNKRTKRIREVLNK